MGLRFPAWMAIPYHDGWTDTVVRPIRAGDGLPPADWAALLSRAGARLSQARPGASLVIQLDAPGAWFAGELASGLRTAPIPWAIVPKGRLPALREFWSYPRRFRPATPPPPLVEPAAGAMTPAELTTLRALARLGAADTAEIAAQAALPLAGVQPALEGLARRGWAVRAGESDDPNWTLTRPGLSIALRSWGAAPGQGFPERPERQYAAADRHRRVSRLWPTWLTQAWPSFELAAGWSEVRLAQTRAHPDALAWGRYQGQEALAWLEVETGNRGASALSERAAERLVQAQDHAKAYGVILLFVVLGPPWATRAYGRGIRRLSERTAVVLGDWNAFGQLPLPELGAIRF